MLRIHYVIYRLLVINYYKKLYKGIIDNLFILSIFIIDNLSTSVMVKRRVKKLAQQLLSFLSGNSYRQVRIWNGSR